MKKIFSILTVFVFMFVGGCGDDAASGNNGGLGGGPGGPGNTTVTFKITMQDGTQGGKLFFATPSVDVVVTQVDVSVPAAQYNETFTDDGTTVYKANQPVQVNEFTGVTSGQQWVFKFQGKIGSSTGTAYNVTTNFTVP